MLLLLALILFVAAIAAAGAAFAKEQPTGLARALEALERSGPAGRELVEAADQPFAERVLAPFQARALTLGRRVTGADKADRIRRRLDFAGNPRGWTVDRVLSLKVICAVALPVAVLAYGLLLGGSFTVLVVLALAAAALGFFVPDLYLYNQAAHRADQIKRNLADSVDLLTISVEAGLGFDAALQQVARNTTGPVAEEFSRVLREMQLGMSRSEALKAMGTRSNVEDLNTFVGSMVQADAFGIPIGQVLRVQSGEIRVKRRQYAEEKAQQVPVKIMIPLILFILPCLFIVVMGPAVLNALDAFNGK
ncbi:type II secretion system F family protein [Nocardioides daeguensis]|uniref:Type II secretion system F family protein n=1 Tax=Nocardioides daeguensis TaxID=908359 RepID=A0ABP6UUW9_9ACTN|nr:type II secretion system F family protein [Nocardioides daeguensis]MBV6725749.1 type II secretion system F family protein [Nocardioides daeguensis]MCR1772736.1 type II secretion system F family protein [Nocardioides daeguensis]